MDKQTIVDYIEESPQNTNKAILNQMLDEYAESSGSGGSVVQADWGQNDTTALDYVKNRTHYTGYGWDNDMSALGSFPRYHFIPSEPEVYGPGYWLGSKIFVLEQKYILTSNSNWTMIDKLGDGGIYAWEYNDPERGLLRLEVEVHSTEGGYNTTWNYNIGEGLFEEAYEIVKTLDEKYIPDTIARAPKAVLEDVTEAPTAEQYNALLTILRQAGILAT